MLSLRAISERLTALANDESLLQEDNLEGRQDALDFIGQAEVALVRGNYSDDGEVLQIRATALKQQLEDTNRLIFQRLQADIQGGHISRAELRELFNRYTDYKPGQAGLQYYRAEALDSLVNGLLEIDNLPRETLPRRPEMVHLDMIPASVILDLIDHAHILESDVFYDLGSGLGQPAILVNLLCGAQATGVEYQPSYCEFARQRADLLGLSGVNFINSDARDAGYEKGTVFYLFTPFEDGMMDTVMDKLRDEPESQRIKICTFGPCTKTFARQEWLQMVYPGDIHEYKLTVFESQV